MARVLVSTSEVSEPTRRDFLYLTTAAAGGVGAAAASWPLISQLGPDASTIAAGAPIEVDLAPIAAGQLIKVLWRGRPIFVRHRNRQEIEEARAVDWRRLPILKLTRRGSGRGTNNGSSLSVSAPIWAASRLPIRESMADGSAHATGRSSTRQVAFAAARRPQTSTFHLMNSLPRANCESDSSARWPLLPRGQRHQRHRLSPTL